MVPKDINTCNKCNSRKHVQSLCINEHKKPTCDINVFTFLSVSLQIKACNIKAFYKQKKKRILLSHFPCDFRKKVANGAKNTSRGDQI